MPHIFNNSRLAATFFWTISSVRWQIAAITCLACGSILAAEPTYDLNVGPESPQVQQVKVVLEAKGDLKLNPDGKELKRVPMQVKGTLEYQERFFDGKSTAATKKTVRYYSQAAVTMQINEGQAEQQLRDSRRLIACHLGGDSATLFSPMGPLTREELDLIEAPGNSAALAMLLPGKRVALRETWQLKEAVIARLVGLETVAEQDVVATFSRVDDGVAIISLAGKVKGAIGGVSSELELAAKMNFDLKRKMVTWLAMSLEEQRAIGHAQPGYDATTRVRVQCEPAELAPELTDKSLAGLPLEMKPGSTLLEFEAEKAGYAFVHDRRWQVVVDRLDGSILRFIDHGDLIAQCNINKLRDLPKGEKLSLEAFQEDVKRTLKRSFGQIAEAAQQQTEAGLRELKVAVAGKSSDLPILWTYYHLSDEQGRRVAFVFALEEKLLSRFAAVDRELLGAFRFVDAPKTAAASEPTPATPAGEPAVEKSAAREATDAVKTK